MFIYMEIKSGRYLTKEEMRKEWSTKLDPDGKDPYGWQWHYVLVGKAKA